MGLSSTGGPPTSHFTPVSGIGRGVYELTAFDGALVAAGIGQYNLVKVSSVLPPGSQMSPVVKLAPGSVLPIAYASIEGTTPGFRLAAAICVGIPEDPLLYGVIMEFAGNCNLEYAESRARYMVGESMSSRSISAYKPFTVSVMETVQEPHTCVFAGLAMWG
jgi:arginine decarboxylase